MAGALIFHTYDDFCRQAGEHIFTILKASLLHKKRSSLVLSGGTTPAGVYRYLAEHYPDFHWQHIDFFIGDDRCVSDDHPDSNYRMIRENFFSLIPHREEQIYRVNNTLPPEEAAQEYHKRIKNYLETNRWFDLVLLGMGPDGHTASLFPGYPELTENVRCAAATRQPAPLEPHVRRVTMTYPALNRCSNLMFLIRGSEKKSIMHSALRDRKRTRGSTEYPVCGVHPEAGSMYWYYTD